MKRLLQRGIHWLKKNPIFVVLFVIGAIVRIVYAGVIPPGLNQDEASIGYDAFALLHYGMDRNGITLPVHLIAWGSGQNALYAYFSMPFIFLFGLNEWSVRAVSILFGVISMLVLYGIAKKLFHNKSMALLALFLIVISPWHIMMSRWALEANLFPSLVLIAVYCLLKGLEKPPWLFGFTFAMALSLYAYGTAYFFVPLFSIVTAIILLASRKLKLTILLWHGGLLTILLLPILLFVFINRYDKEAISTPFLSIPKLTVPRVEEVSSAFSGGSLQGMLHHFQQFMEIFLRQHDGLLWNAMPAFGYMYPIALPFIMIGIGYTVYLSIKWKNMTHAIMAIWFVTAILMTFITDVNINRINIIFYPIILFTAGGLIWVQQYIRYFLKLAIPAFALYFLLFCWQYFNVFPENLSPMFYESFGEALQYASSETEETIYITQNVNMPYIYVLFYEQIDPRLFVDTVQYMNPGGAFQVVRSFDRYVFEEPSLRPGEEAAYVFRKSDPFPDKSQLQGYRLKEFKHFIVISDQREEAAYLQEQFRNGGFEDGQAYWKITPGAGIGYNRPYEGAALLYLESGEAIRAEQSFRVVGAGQYEASAWVSSNGSGGKFGISINDEIVHEAEIPSSESYVMLPLPPVLVQGNEVMTIYFSGGAGWVNVDDVRWRRIN